MGEIVFVRHGQASFGTDDYDRLSPLGWQQARWLGEHMAGDGWRFDRAIMGGMRRHRETASAMAEGLDLPDFDVAPGLNEMNFNQLQTDAVRAGVADAYAMQQPDTYAAEFVKILVGWEAGHFKTDHEPFTEFEARVQSDVADAMIDGQSVLIVSSGGPKAMVMRQVLGLSTAKAAEVTLGILNSSITRLDVRNGGLRLGEFNATPHLSGPDRAHARTFI